MTPDTRKQVEALAQKLKAMVQKKAPLESVSIPAQNVRLMCEAILERPAAPAPKPRKPVALPLTLKQKDCLKAVEALTVKLGESPSVRQVAEHMGIKHHSAAAALIQNLVKKGYVERSPVDKMLKVVSH